MWNAKYKNIDKGGLRPELTVTVVFSNGSEEMENTYQVMPEDLKTNSFQGLVQVQLDILNNKDIKEAEIDIVPDDVVIKK